MNGFWFIAFYLMTDSAFMVTTEVFHTEAQRYHCKYNDILHADVSWPLSELIRLWLQFVDFSNFDAILT